MTREQDSADAAANSALLLWSRLIQGAAAVVIVLSLTLLLSPRCGRRRRFDQGAAFSLTKGDSRTSTKTLGFSASRLVSAFRHIWSIWRRRQHRGVRVGWGLAKREFLSHNQRSRGGNPTWKSRSPLFSTLLSKQFSLGQAFGYVQNKNAPEGASLLGHWRGRIDCLANSLSFLTPCFWWSRGFEPPMDCCCSCCAWRYALQFQYD